MNIYTSRYLIETSQANPTMPCVNLIIQPKREKERKGPGTPFHKMHTHKKINKFVANTIIPVNVRKTVKRKKKNLQIQEEEEEE